LTLPMKQPAPHAPPLQTSPPPQPVPFATLLHAVVLAIGWQLMHVFAGSSEPTP